jgi:hypothetical protein
MHYTWFCSVFVLDNAGFPMQHTVQVCIEWCDVEFPYNLALRPRFDQANVFHQFQVVALLQA